MKKVISLTILTGWGLCLAAQSIIFAEMTPAATGLNGLTLLCESASDNIGNPVTTAYGTTTNYINPFSIDKLNIYGFHSAQWISFIKLGAGTSYICADKYRQTDYYINTGISVGSLVLGYTHHFVFYKIDDDHSFEDGNDFGIRFDYKTGMAEAIFRQPGSHGNEWLINALWRVAPEFHLATGILSENNREYCYRLGTNAKIGDILFFFASWQSEPSRLGFGVRLSWNKSDLIYAVRQHNELKMTHAVEIGYRW